MQSNKLREGWTSCGCRMSCARGSHGGAGPWVRGVHAVAMSVYEWDVLGEPGPMEGWVIQQSFWGSNPFPECSCTSQHGGRLGDSAGSEETKEKFYLSCNNRPLKKKKERERISWKRKFSITKVATEQNKYSRPFPGTLLRYEAARALPSQQSHFPPDISRKLTLVSGNVKLLS